MVLKNCGPKGYPGMAEVGNMPLPPKLLKKGITDMVRISDARMSGTAYGTVVLHISPEAAAGGALALVENGDTIELDVAQRKLHLAVSDAELAKTQGELEGARRRRSTAATGSSTSTTCTRRTRAPTSTSWSERAAPSCRATITEEGLCCRPLTSPSGCIRRTTSSSRGSRSRPERCSRRRRYRRWSPSRPGTRSRCATSRRARRCAATTRSSASPRAPIKARRARPCAQHRHGRL